MRARKPLKIETLLEQSGGSFINKYRLMRDRLLNVEYEHWAAGFAEGNNHGRGHITRVLNNLDHLLGAKPLDLLDPYELFLAMMAILYHDIGLLRQRKGHEAGSKAFLEGDKNDAYVINAIDKEIIAAAVVSHSSSRDIEEECRRFSPEELIGEHRARPRVIAALVRLADELDEDHRRADAILQRRLDLPEESAFFWLFCQRVRAVRPNLVAKRIDVNFALEATDTEQFGPLPGGEMRHFVAFCAEKLAKINQERVYVNRFLPPELQYGTLHIDVKPLPGHAKWISPRTFVFNDKTTAEMFLRGFPELLDDPARKQIQAALELMRLEKLGEADRKLDALASVIIDLPADVRINIPYERACIQSFRAKNSGAGTPERDAALDAAEKCLIEWYHRGHDGGWDAIGRTAAAEVHRMASDGDLAFVRRMRGPRLKEAIPASLWPKPKAGGGGGGLGCLPIGTLIDTPAGPQRVEDLRAGDPILSFNPTDSQCVRSTVAEVRTSRTPCCICLNHGWLATPGQRIRASSGWVRVGGLQLGDRVMDRGGSLVEVLSTVPHSGYFETFDLSVAGPYHSYVADGLLCHNNPNMEEK
jgi:hypothetical protein